MAVERPPVAAGVAVLVAGGVWATAFLVEPSLVAGSRWAIGLGAWLLTLVALVGLLVARSRWAVRTALVVAGLAVPGVALVDDSILVGIGAAASVGAVHLALSGRTAAAVRPHRAADAPPDEAVVLMLLGAAVPLVVGLGTLPDGPGPVAIAVAVVGPVLAWWFGRISLVALWAFRVLLPAGLLAVAVLADLPASTLAVLAAGAVGWFAWQPEVRLAADPLDPVTGTAKPVFAELAPREVRAAAGVDERGRRQP